MTWDLFVQYIKDNIGAIILLFVMLVLIILKRHKIINTFRRKPKIQKSIEDEVYFLRGKAKQTFSDPFLEQKKRADEELELIQQEGKKVVQEEQQLDVYYHNNKVDTENRKKYITHKYNTWKSYADNLNQLIENQKRLDESMKRLK